MIMFDYSFLENPEGKDLPFDTWTVVMWTFTPTIDYFITYFLTAYGLDFAWVLAVGYNAYYQLFVGRESVLFPKEKKISGKNPEYEIEGSQEQVPLQI